MLPYGGIAITSEQMQSLMRRGSHKYIVESNDGTFFDGNEDKYREDKTLGIPQYAWLGSYVNEASSDGEKYNAELMHLPPEISPVPKFSWTHKQDYMDSYLRATPHWR